jgi:hypothetical protein
MKYHRTATYLVLVIGGILALIFRERDFGWISWKLNWNWDAFVAMIWFSGWALVLDWAYDRP